MQNRFHTFTFFVFCIAKKICQENPAVIHYVGVRFPNGRNRNVPRKTFLSVNIFFKKTYRTSSRLVHEKRPVHSADEVKASKKAYSSFPEKTETNASGGGVVF